MRARDGGRRQLTGPILVGVIGAPHGVRGEVRIKSFTGEPAAIATYGALRSENGRLRLTLQAVRPIKDDMMVARLEGVTTREAAAKLTGTRLVIDRAALPDAEEDEFYHADLIGMVAELEDGRVLGQVMAVAGFGAGDLLEIRPPSGDSLMVPFTKAFVPVIDLAGRRVVVASGALDGDEGEDGDLSGEPA